MALLHDHRGDLWIGTLDAGLVRMSAATGAFKSYRHDPKNPQSLAANGVTTIFEDRDGRLWLGTYGRGLDRFDPETERFTHFRHDATNPSSLSGDRIAAVAENADGRLWIATMESGLNLLDPTDRAVRALPAPVGRSAQPADGRGARPVRRRRRQPLGGHPQRPQPPPCGRQVLRDLQHAERPAQRRGVRHPQRPSGTALAEHQQRPEPLRLAHGPVRELQRERRPSVRRVQPRRLVPEHERRAVLRRHQRLQRLHARPSPSRRPGPAGGADRRSAWDGGP